MARKTPKPKGSLVPTNGRALPTRQPDVGKHIRWWAKENLGEVLDTGTSIPKAYKDLGLIATAHLINRLTDRRTPAIEKDRIALVVAPKLSAEVKGRLGQTPDGPGELGGLLGDYGVAKLGS